MNILLVYPCFQDTFWSFHYALEFLGKKASSPPLGLATVAAMLPAEWNKRLVDMNVRDLKQKDLEWADMVFLSAMNVQRKSVQKTIARCNAAGVPVVAGGPLFTGEYDQFETVD
ncbi:MAG: cobalamin B12-binding domain-containing protein, partial [Anaerolineaceae bacterium]|nr:cobalamin B12-binding domain-containing protein [Anaerolineaceae bacterium]